MMKKFLKQSFGFILLALCAFVYASVPQWWVERGIVVSADGEASSATIDENYSVANVGQLMNIAKLAADELNDKVPNSAAGFSGGAGSEITALVSAFPIYNANKPDANYVAVNIGQLKYVSKSFYDRLWEIESAYPNSVTWPTGMTFFSGGTDSTNHKYPWTALPASTASNYAAEMDKNYLAANIGQIKYLFSWDVNIAEPEIDPNADTDGDGIPDWWELQYGLDPNNAADASALDDYSVAYLTLYLSGLEPNVADADNDGLPSAWEIANGLNPCDASDATADADNDGLMNFQEYNTGTNPQNADTDGDGFSDGEEVMFGGNPLDPAEALSDYDGDGLADMHEMIIGTSVYSADTDGDGLKDGDEYNHGLDYLKKTAEDYDADSDADGIPNGAELALGLNPFNAADALLDMDSDGLNNYQEYILGTRINEADTDGDGIFDGVDADPFHAPANALDSDNDGLPDAWEQKHFWSAASCDPAADSDNDGLTNLQEYQLGTNPTKFDTDGDGLSDGWEHQYSAASAPVSSPMLFSVTAAEAFFNPRKYDNPLGDYDSDNLSNAEEVYYGTDPQNADTDGDGRSDGDEAKGGGNPKDPSDANQPLSPEKMVKVYVYISCGCLDKYTEVHKHSVEINNATIRTEKSTYRGYLFDENKYDDDRPFVSAGGHIYVQKGQSYPVKTKFENADSHAWCHVGIDITTWDEGRQHPYYLDPPQTEIGCYSPGEKNGTLTIFDFEFITPKQLEPKEKITKANRIKSGEGQNAYVFSGTPPPEYTRDLPPIDEGEFDMNIKIKVLPMDHGLSDETMHFLMNYYLDVDLNVYGKIEKEWTYFDGYKFLYENGYLYTTVKCKGLPPRNEHFGTKMIELSSRANILAQTKFQMFYQLRGANNPEKIEVSNPNGYKRIRPINLVYYYSDAINALRFSGDNYEEESYANYRIMTFNADGFTSAFDRNNFTYIAGIRRENVGIASFMKRQNGDVFKSLSYLSLFTYAYNHENRHVRSLISWWSTPANFANGRSIGKDTDTDDIPDALEYYTNSRNELVCDTIGLPYFPYTGELMQYKRNEIYTYWHSNIDARYNVYYDDFNHYVNSIIDEIDERAHPMDWAVPGSQYNEGEILD